MRNNEIICKRLTEGPSDRGTNIVPYRVTCTWLLNIFSTKIDRQPVKAPIDFHPTSSYISVLSVEKLELVLDYESKWIIDEQSMLVMVSGDISWMTEFTRKLKLVKPLKIIFPQESLASIQIENESCLFLSGLWGPLEDFTAAASITIPFQPSGRTSLLTKLTPMWNKMAALLHSLCFLLGLESLEMASAFWFLDLGIHSIDPADLKNCFCKIL